MNAKTRLVGPVRVTKTNFQVSNDMNIRNYIYPGLELDDFELSTLLNQLDYINQNCHTNLNYGIFAPNLTLKQRRILLENAYIAIAYQDEEAIAANHGFIYTDPSLELPLIYYGLTQNNSKRRMDLTGLMHLLSLRLQSEHFEETMVSTITIHPKIAETFDSFAKDTFPSPNYKSKRAPIDYEKYAQLVIDRYATPFWANQGEVRFDKRRFCLSIENKDKSGFNKEGLDQIVRAEYWMYDLFMEHKLNWSKNEDMLLIGRATKEMFKGVQQKVKQMENSNE